uniref:Uncharacterized protein n=1 Tax=Rhizophora mucronata TaxID=61149 RepID=A0A2P2PXJ9_RHIMU
MVLRQKKVSPDFFIVLPFRLTPHHNTIALNPSEMCI